MALTAFPIITVDTASADTDTTASGAGPATAVTGTTNAVVNSTTITFAGLPDLSGVATDGSHVLMVDGLGFVRISTVDNVGKSVVVETAMTISAGTAFAIGGKVKSLNGTNARKLFAATSGPATNFGASGRWTISLASDDVISSVIPLAFTAGTGTLVVQSDTPGTRRKITQSAAARHFQSNTSNRIRFTDDAFENSNGSALEVFEISANSPIIEVRNCLVGNNAGTNCPKGLYVRTGGAGILYLYNTAVLRCSGPAISGSITTLVINGCDISRNNGPALSTTSNASLIVTDSIISHNSGDGLLFAASNGSPPQVIRGCTIHGNTGDGIEISGANVQFPQIVNCNLTGNGGYGLNCSNSGTPHAPIVQYNNFGNASDSTSNTSGAANNFTLDGTNLTAACGYTDASAAVRNFTVGPNLKAAGFPVSNATIGAGQSGTTSYVDIGASQAQASSTTPQPFAVCGS